MLGNEIDLLREFGYDGVKHILQIYKHMFIYIYIHYQQWLCCLVYM